MNRGWLAIPIISAALAGALAIWGPRPSRSPVEHQIPPPAAAPIPAPVPHQSIVPPAPPPPPPSLPAASTIPADAWQWQRPLIREARSLWGLSAPSGTFAAQIHQESLWRPAAKSRAGALGMAQFMPATASWISGAYPDLGQAQPTNPQWAIRALVRYDRHIWDAATARDDCNRMAKTLSGYNGGPGWIARDEAAARTAGLDPMRWWGNVEAVNAGRSAANWRENRAYPRRVLRLHEPAYVAGGFGFGACTAPENPLEPRKK